MEKEIEYKGVIQERDSIKVYSPKLGKEIEVYISGMADSTDPRKENIGVAPTTWW